MSVKYFFGQNSSVFGKSYDKEEEEGEKSNRKALYFSGKRNKQIRKVTNFHLTN